MVSVFEISCVAMGGRMVLGAAILVTDEAKLM
jgi:hypothetical protein